MGLDVALGVVILIAAIRGWLQGFLYQILRIGGLIACVYLAAPVRDQARPYVTSYLPTIGTEVLDRILWWVWASVCYIVIVGAGTLVVKMTRRPEIPGMPRERSRNDQFAGFLLGIAKGGLIGAFLVAALDTYGLKHVESVPWAQQQAKTSLVLQWNRQFHPAAKVWESVPVHHFVRHIQRMGLPGQGDGASPNPDEAGGDRPVVQTARKTPGEGRTKAARRAEAQAPPPPAPKASAGQVADPQVAKAAEEIKAALDAAKPK